jgi:spore coat protein U-like protein
MTRTSLRLALAAGALAVALAAGDAAAQTVNFTVSASVAKACTITAGNVALGAYEPIGAHDAAALVGTGTISVRCTRGTAYGVALGDGANFSATRRMRHATLGEFLGYDLFSDAARTVAWNTAAPVSGTAPSKAPIPLTVYVSVPGGQDVPEGAYSDTVAATVNF